MSRCRSGTNNEFRGETTRELRSDWRQPGRGERRARARRPRLPRCWTSPTTKINEVFGYQLAGACETLFPTFGDTRTAAGGGLTGDTLKCQLKPLNFADYAVTFTPAQQARLAATFPAGVCDWSKPSVDEREPLGTWLDYGP